MNPIYSVEGNIGSGKSTFIDILIKEKYFKNVVYLKEPVHIWETIKDKENETILEKFYKNQEKYSFSFQIMAYISRLSELKKVIKKNPKKIILTERSILTDKNVFAKMLYDDKKIEEINYKIYLKWFDDFMSDFNFCGVIYIQTNPEICNKRIKKRNRKGEENIPMKYSVKCHIYHEDWINNIQIINKNNYKKLYLDGNVNFKENIPIEWYEKMNKLFMKDKWDLSQEQKNNLSKNKYFDHYISFNNCDEKLVQKDGFSNSFV